MRIRLQSLKVSEILEVPALRLLILVLALFIPGSALFNQSVSASSSQRSEEAEFEKIIDLLELKEGMSVADVGAGGATWTIRLARKVGPQGKVFATDIREPQVNGIRSAARARGLTNITAILGSEQEVGLPSACCDGLLLRLVYHAFDNPALMVQGMGKAMKPGSKVLVIDFRPDPKTMEAQMSRAGFEKIQVIDKWLGSPEIFAVVFRKK